MRTGVSVADVMRHQVVAVRERARFAEIVTAMRRFGISSVPVVDSEDRVVGMICDDDLLWAEHRRGPSRPHGLLNRLPVRRRRADVTDLWGADAEGKVATDVMSAPVVTVTARTPARDAAREMYRRGVHQLPVVDPATGRLTGMVTRGDLLAVYERPDEDIRREILYDIIERTLGMPPERFEVTCKGGTVTIRGRLERRSAALRLAGAIAHVDGVIAVRDRLTFVLDDTAANPPAARL